MNGLRIIAAAGAAALLAACSSGPQGTPSASGAGSAASANAAGAVQGSSGNGGGQQGSGGSSGQLSMKRAEQTYQAIISPGSAIANALARDSSGSTPYRQFRSDALAYARELHAEIGKLSAVNWPSRVQPHITRMIKHDFPADIGCLRALGAAGSTRAAQSVTGTNHDCMIADNANIPNSLQSMLAS